MEYGWNCFPLCFLLWKGSLLFNYIFSVSNQKSNIYTACISFSSLQSFIELTNNGLLGWSRLFKE
jgi:hypothetical protein